MATLKGQVTVRVDQPGEDEAKSHSALTCFGLPGVAPTHASMSSCHFDVICAVYDNLAVYVGFSGQISDPVRAAEGYSVCLVASPNDWAWRQEGGQLVGPSGTPARWDATIDASNGAASLAPSWANGQTADAASSWETPMTGRGWFIWNLYNQGVPQTIDGTPAEVNGFRYAGQLTEFGASTSDVDGLMYVSGTGTYDMTNPVYPDPVAITVPGFLEYLDYFPFAVNHDGWASCNRAGGHTQQFANGAWVDRKNVAQGTGTNHAHYWDGGAWKLCPEIGAK